MLPARRPYPDELLYSALLRCSRQFNISLIRLGAILAVDARWRPTFFGAGRTRECSKIFRVGPRTLMWRHTNVLYATRFLPLSDRQRALEELFQRTLTPALSRKVTFTMTAGLKYRRFCKICASEEFSELGESYWHRSHNLPCVWVCTKHNAYLQQSDVLLSTPGEGGIMLPHECAGISLGNDPAMLAGVLAVARFSCTWLNAAPGVGGPLEQGYYLRMAMANGWAPRPMAFDCSRLLRHLSSAFPSQLLREAEPRHKPEWAKWPVGIFEGRPAGAFVPAKHAILHAYLSGGATGELPF